MNYRDITKRLKKLGCQEVSRRSRGSHRKWYNPTTERATVVPDWGGKDLKLGRQSGPWYANWVLTGRILNKTEARIFLTFSLQNGTSIGRGSGIKGLTKERKRSTMRSVEGIYNAARGSHQTNAR